MAFDLKRIAGVGQQVIGVVMRTGLLDPLLAGMSESATRGLGRVTGLVEKANLIYSHRKAIGTSTEATFGEFLGRYLSGITADAVDSSAIDAQALVTQVVNVLIGVMGSSPKFWNASIKNLEGFTQTDLGKGLHGLSQTAYYEVRPVIIHVLERVRADYGVALDWQSNNT